MEDLISQVMDKIKCDETASDLQWSLFQSALSSYRRDSVLRPYPTALLSNHQDQEKDFTALKSIADEVPNLRTILQSSSRSKHITEQAWRLLSWALLEHPVTVSTHAKSKFQRIQELTGQASYQVTPSYVFEVEYNSATSQRFEELRQSRDIIHAYHGSRLDNFYSILHNGLHAHMNKDLYTFATEEREVDQGPESFLFPFVIKSSDIKDDLWPSNSLFGEGTYLSSDLSVSMLYSPIGTAWEGSNLGTTLSCVAVCELIDHADVKCQTRERRNSSNDGRRRSHAPQSMGGEVPEKYYVVTNNEVVRVKYLLVFADKTQSKRSAQPRSKVTTFVCSHMFSLCMVGYLIVLLLIGLLNSRTFQTFYRKHFGSR